LERNSIDPGIDGMIILIWIFRKQDGGHGMDCSGSGERERGVADTCKCGNKISGSIT
jgi:hypothetical protein